jgi:hypothetical protein
MKAAHGHMSAESEARSNPIIGIQPSVLSGFGEEAPAISRSSRRDRSHQQTTNDRQGPRDDAAQIMGWSRFRWNSGITGV